MLGAQYLEKHINNRKKKPPDYISDLEHKEFIEFNKFFKNFNNYKKIKNFWMKKICNRNGQTCVINKKINKGQIIDKDDLLFLGLTKMGSEEISFLI